MDQEEREVASTHEGRDPAGSRPFFVSAAPLLDEGHADPVGLPQGLQFEHVHPGGHAPPGAVIAVPGPQVLAGRELFRPEVADQPAAQVAQQPAGETSSLASVASESPPVKEATPEMMAERKQEYGLDKGVDYIVKDDESVQLGGTTIRMAEIIEQIKLDQGTILEEDLTKKAGQYPGIYGIHVVKPGDNLWNIHFKMLQEYFGSKGKPIDRLADESDQEGYSSSIGRILKFSEKMVHIYNLNIKKLTTNINFIEPFSKIVIFNLDSVKNLLDNVKDFEVDKIHFDGENIWIAKDLSTGQG